MWGCYFWQVRCNLWRDGEKYVKFGGDFVMFSSAGEWVGLFADRKNVLLWGAHDKRMSK